jgi:pimeloyl-ACP methyl ester carboxylesterase
LAAASLVLAALAAAGGALTLRTAAARAAAEEAAHPPSGQFVDIGGRRVHAHVTGEGPDVVLIHGAFGSLRDFTFDLSARLSDRYRVIALDRPGLGYTDRTDPAYAAAFAASAESPAEQAALLAAAARELGAERPIVVGHSFGGIVAMAWALDHDPAAVVMLAGVAMPWPGELGWLYQVNGTALGGGLVAPAISAWAPRAVLRDSVAATFAPQAMPRDTPTTSAPTCPSACPPSAPTRARSTRSAPMWWRWSGATPPSPPIEIVHGDADTTVPLVVHAGPLSRLVPPPTSRSCPASATCPTTPTPTPPSPPSTAPPRAPGSTEAAAPPASRHIVPLRERRLAFNPGQ